MNRIMELAEECRLGVAREELREEVDRMEREIEDLKAELARFSVVAWGFPMGHRRIYDVITPEEHDRAPGRYNIPLYTRSEK